MQITIVKKLFFSVKDFNHFVDVKFGGFEFGAGESRTDVMWNQQLLSLKGEEWKAVRSAFTPIFTSGKMKLMLSFMKEVSTVSESDKFGKFNLN